MPVLFDSSAGKFATGVAADGSLSVSQVVNELAENRVAVVGVLWVGNLGGGTTNGSMSVTFGGAAMSGATPVRWNSDNCMFQVFTLTNPTTGTQQVVASVSGMDSAGTLGVASATYSGVATIGNVVSASPTETTSNSVTVSSVSEAYRVVTLHATSANDRFSAYDKVQRAQVKMNTGGLFDIDIGVLLLGDAPGAGSVTATATQPSTPNWGAFGIPLTPAPVLGDASMGVVVDFVSGGAIFRANRPTPAARTWLIEV